MVILFALILYDPVKNFSHVEMDHPVLNQYYAADKKAFKCPPTKK